MDMDHDLNDLFRERFQGHEAAVPSGTWQGIQARMATAATPVDGGDKVADLFRERFHDHEMAVDPAVWQGISAQLGHVAVGTTATAEAYNPYADSVICPHHAGGRSSHCGPLEECTSGNRTGH